nr:LLM class flavin-dependent oxidoreductase [Microbacterium sp. zg.Y818]
MITLGYEASAEQFGPRELVELAVDAERQGFESVAVSDHFQPWRHTGGHARFSLAWIAAVGERTERIRIGTSVMTPTFRYNPAVIAQAFATLGCLNPGRVWLGVGQGKRSTRSRPGFAAPGHRTGRTSGNGSRGCASPCGSCARSGRGECGLRRRLLLHPRRVDLRRPRWREPRVHRGGCTGCDGIRQPRR